MWAFSSLEIPEVTTVHHGVGGPCACASAAGQEVQPHGALQVWPGHGVRRYSPSTERAGLPHRVLHRAVPRERHRHVDRVRAACVLGGGRDGHVELEGPVGQAGRRALEDGHQDGQAAAGAGRGDEHAAADHAAGAVGVDAPGDPAAGALRRPERQVRGAVRWVVRPEQGGAEHGQLRAPLERPRRRLEPGGRAALGCRGGGRGQQHQHGPGEEPHRVVSWRHRRSREHVWQQ